MDADIIKTWPAFIEARKVAQSFSRAGAFGRYYFTLGRGKPQKPIRRIGSLGTVAFWGALQSRQLSATTGHCLRCGASVGKSASGRFDPTPGSLFAYRAVNGYASASI